MSGRREEPPTVLGGYPSMSKAHSGTEISTAARVRCPECNNDGSFGLGTDGDLRCPECGEEFDPHADPNAPKNPRGLESDAVDPDGDEPGTYWCPRCGARVTRSPTDPNIEYGHRTGHNPDKGDRCPRRPATVDTDDGRTKAALSMHETLGIGRFAADEESEGEEADA